MTEPNEHDELPRLPDDEESFDSHQVVVSLEEDMPSTTDEGGDTVTRAPDTALLTKKQTEALEAAEREKAQGKDAGAPRGEEYERRKAWLISTLESAPFDPNKLDTAVLRAKKNQQRRANAEAGEDLPLELETSAGQREIILVIRGMVERVMLKTGQTILLGRADHKTRTFPDVDLTPYGALDRGVSREHATIHMEDDRIYVTDLNSTNGTYLDGERLVPHQPYVMAKGKELLLGKLAVQVLSR